MDGFLSSCTDEELGKLFLPYGLSCPRPARSPIEHDKETTVKTTRVHQCLAVLGLSVMSLTFSACSGDGGSPGVAGDQFGGFAVALSGDGATLAVGAYLEDSNATGVGGNQADNSAVDAGGAYIY